MATTIDSDLLLATMSDVAVTVAQNTLVGLDVFASDFSNELVDPRRPTAIPFVSDASAAQVNPTNFETGTTTVGARVITPEHISKSAVLSNAHLNQGQRLEHLLEITMHRVADKVLEKALTPITTSNFGSAVISAPTPADLDGDDLRTLWGALPKSLRKNIILRPDYFANFLPTNKDSFGYVNGAMDGAFGFDRFRQVGTFEGAAADTIGFVCTEKAIGMAARVPETASPIADNGTLLTDTVTVPGLGLTIQMNAWFSLGGRNNWVSYDVMFGATLLDGSQGVILDDDDS
jgi:hypothetical protein